MGRTVFAWTIGVAYTLFWSSLGIITWPFSPRGELYLSFARTWSQWILGTLRIPLSVESKSRLEPDKPYIFMSNHRSIFDIFALFLATEHSLRMVAKRVLFFIPIFGWALWMCRFIPIDRSNREKAIESLENAARKIREGISVLVFPEGTRGPGEPLLPFKKGSFMMALKAGVPVVPVVVLGTEDVMEARSLRVGYGAITVRLGTPIATADRGTDARDDLMREVRVAMEAMMAEPVAQAASGK
jgi:1-acyl-sn-glycerol-3-phosphate acyltransferase